MRAPLLRALAPLLPGLGLGSGGAAGAACLIAARSKTTTGIVGLPVVPDARGELQRAYQAVLDALDAAIPADAEYRRSVEKTVRWKLAAAAGDAPDEQLEELYSRQLEEEIKLCREELALIPKMAGAWRAAPAPRLGGRRRAASGRRRRALMRSFGLAAGARCCSQLAAPAAPLRATHAPVSLLLQSGSPGTCPTDTRCVVARGVALLSVLHVALAQPGVLRSRPAVVAAGSSSSCWLSSSEQQQAPGAGHIRHGRCTACSISRPKLTPSPLLSPLPPSSPDEQVEMLEAQAVEAKVAGGAASPATPAAPPPPPPK